MSKNHQPAEDALLREIDRLRNELRERNGILEAIQQGEVDALLISGKQSDQVYILKGADHVYRVLVEEMQEGCATIASNGTILFCNKNFADILQTPLEQVIGSSFHDWLAIEDKLRFATFLLSGEGSFKAECPLSTGLSYATPVIMSASNVTLEGDTFACLVLTDLTEQRQSERLTALILDQAKEPIIACDKTGLITQANPAATVVFGPQLVGRHFDAAVPLFRTSDGSRLTLNMAVDADFPSGVEAQYERSDGSGTILLVKAGRFRTEPEDQQVSCVVTLTDITEKRLLENELARLDRLNIVGEVAAGIGHEVRNPLTTVRGYLQMFTFKEKYADDRKSLRLMIEELDRANSIITEFLSLAKNKSVERIEGCLNDTLRVLLPLLQADAFRLGHQIEVQPGEIPYIQYDDKEMRQLILNLVRNGLEAMPPKGLVTIQTYIEGEQVVLAVKDSGPGIPREAQDRLGTPFFTTKETGTGLGLSVCYSIADRHDAKLDYETSPIGTTFFVRFPRSLT